MSVRKILSIVFWVPLTGFVLCQLGIRIYGGVKEWARGTPDEVLARVPSPDGKLEAVIIVIKGDATTPIGYSLGVVPATEHLSDGETEFIVDHVHGPDDITLKWSGNRLVVSFNPAVRIFRQMSAATIHGKSITIDYRPRLAGP